MQDMQNVSVINAVIPGIPDNFCLGVDKVMSCIPYVSLLYICLHRTYPITPLTYILLIHIVRRYSMNASI